MIDGEIISYMGHCGNCGLKIEIEGIRKYKRGFFIYSLEYFCEFCLDFKVWREYRKYE